MNDIGGSHVADGYVIRCRILWYVTYHIVHILDISYAAYVVWTYEKATQACVYKIGL